MPTQANNAFVDGQPSCEDSPPQSKMDQPVLGRSSSSKTSLFQAKEQRPISHQPAISRKSSAPCQGSPSTSTPSIEAGASPIDVAVPQSGQDSEFVAATPLQMNSKEEKRDEVVSEKPTLGLALVGNPGTGKSTILNGLVGSPRFKAGISLGTGLTTNLVDYQTQYLTLFDTPGLADLYRHKEAGLELDKLLQTDCDLKIIFVVVLKDGRARVEDRTTIHAVLSSIQFDVKNQFGVIVNKVSKRVQRELEDSAKMAKLQREITAQFETCHWHFLPMVCTLRDEDNGCLGNSELTIFFSSVPFTRPRGVPVKNIDTDGLEDIKEETENTIRALQNGNEATKKVLMEQYEAQKRIQTTRIEEIMNQISRLTTPPSYNLIRNGPDSAVERWRADASQAAPILLSGNSPFPDTNGVTHGGAVVPVHAQNTSEIPHRKHYAGNVHPDEAGKRKLENIKAKWKFLSLGSAVGGLATTAIGVVSWNPLAIIAGATAMSVALSTEIVEANQPNGRVNNAPSR